MARYESGDEDYRAKGEGTQASFAVAVTTMNGANELEEDKTAIRVAERSIADALTNKQDRARPLVDESDQVLLEHDLILLN